MFGRKRKASEFDTPYTCTAALTKGAPETKLSMFVMGLGSFVHGQRIHKVFCIWRRKRHILCL